MRADAEDTPRLLSDAELDGAVLTWANEKLAAAGCNRRMRSFSDPDLASGLLLIHLLAALQPRLVNWSLVTAGLVQSHLLRSCTLSLEYAAGCGF